MPVATTEKSLQVLKEKARSKAIPFEESFKFSNGETITFSAQSLQKWIDAAVSSHLLDIPKGQAVSVGSDYEFLWRRRAAVGMVYRSMFSSNRCPSQLEDGLYGSGKRASWCVDDDVWIPILRSSSEVLMSLTPMEVASCRQGIKRCKGHVLMGGLGLGWMLARAAARKQVKSITVIEKDIDILKFFGKPFEVDPKVSFVNDDVWRYVVSNDLAQFDSIVLDVWDGYAGAFEDPFLLRLRDECEPLGVPVWAWGEVGTVPENGSSFWFW